MIIHAMLL